MNSPSRAEIHFEDMRCCRSCLSVASEDELEDYIDLLETLNADCGTITLLESFNKCTSLNVVIEEFVIEGYPSCHYICGRCRLELKQANEFINRAQLNNQLLKEQYSHTKFLHSPLSDAEVHEIEISNEPNCEASENEQEFKPVCFTEIEYEQQISPVMTAREINEPLEEVLQEDNEIPATTLISVERVFCNDGKNVDNNSPTSIENNELIISANTSRNEEDTDIEETDKTFFEFKCEFCTCIFEFQRDLLQHYEIDHADQTLNFPCDFCQNRFVTKNALRLHRRQVHQKDEYQDCEHCGRTVLKTFYNVHLRRHKQLKFLCSKCPKRCVSRYTLKKHMELHSDERDRNIECIDCGRRFYTLENLQLHQATHISPEDRAIFECTVCSKTFLRKSNLGLHMQMHRGETMDCPHCDKKFVRRKDLEIHIRFHTGDFPYSCSMCERKFAIKGHLNYHEKRHLGVRYKCDECEKTFINLAGLRQHQYEHTGMPLMCDVCQRGFATKFKVHRHLRNVHKHLFKKTGFTDALAKKYIIVKSKSTQAIKKVTELVDVPEDTIEMLEEHAEDIPLNMLTV
ncbi:zinc finger protein 81 [Zeugodacus cucurbitae]|uniref:Zinc finger protein 26 n=1 Tax=Zeugodacus cucurbitae TaxID=28588 RepID=A0A0A1WE57_ZEUCU|nr:zinc finger protein 81 [Zeugodacus cucurbitae]